jgi:hypothetical protein
MTTSRRPRTGPIRRWVDRAGRAVERSAGRLSRRPGLSVAAVGLLGFLAAAATSTLIRWPIPIQHDEFSYLLAADTFTRGRMANPTHPLWVFFETMHVIHQPTYAAKYPPGQGLLLAAGRLVGGREAVGAWIGAGLASAAIAWMLRAWLPPRWAVLGGLLAVVHPTLHGWGQSYWGGSLAAAGGALLIGAVGRITDRPRARDAIWLGVGLLVLANARPFEGFVLAVLSAAALLGEMARGRGPRVRDLARRVGPPALLVLVPGLAAMAAYNRAVTGSPTTMPYSVHEATYSSAPLFAWQPIGPPKSFRHPVLADFQLDWCLRKLRGPRTLGALLAEARSKLAEYADAYFPMLGPTAYRSPGALWGLLKRSLLLLLVQLPLLGLPLGLWDRKLRLPVALLAGFAAALAAETWNQPHYAAPAACLTLLVTLLPIRRLRAWRPRGRPVGRLAVRAGLVLGVAWLVPWAVFLTRAAAVHNHALEHRPAILADLQARGGKHLVVVRYAPGHDSTVEWVYNGAEIDGQAVVWAREMDGPENRRLLDYYRDRSAWLLEADARPPRLAPYPRP